MATEAQAEAAIKKLRLMIEAAENSNQAGEDAVVAAAAGPSMLTALRPFAAYGATLRGQATRGDSVLIKLWDHKITVGDFRLLADVFDRAEGRQS